MNSDVLNVLNNRLPHLNERRAARIDSENVLYLRRKNDQCDGACEAGRDRTGNEIDEKTEAEDTHKKFDKSGQEAKENRFLRTSSGGLEGQKGCDGCWT